MSIISTRQSNPGVNRINQQYRAEQIELALTTLVDSIDAIRTDLGDKYPALSEAYTRAKAALVKEKNLA